MLLSSTQTGMLIVISFNLEITTFAPSAGGTFHWSATKVFHENSQKTHFQQAVKYSGSVKQIENFFHKSDPPTVYILPNSWRRFLQLYFK